MTQPNDICSMNYSYVKDNDYADFKVATIVVEKKIYQGTRECHNIITQPIRSTFSYFFIFRFRTEMSRADRVYV